MIEEIDGFIPALVKIGTHMADLRYFRVLPRVGESVEHVDGADPLGGHTSYRVVDVWHTAWHPTAAAEDPSGCPTIVLEDPRWPTSTDRPSSPRLSREDVDLIVARIVEELTQDAG